MDPALPRAQLLIRCGSWLCALPLSEVIETMRPLPLQPVSGAPDFVRGLSIIRGELVPVVSLGRFFGVAARPLPNPQGPAASGERLVLLRAGARRLAIAVDEVVRVLPQALSEGVAVAPLLRQALPEPVAALATLDGAALAILAPTHILPEAVWRTLAEAHDV